MCVCWVTIVNGSRGSKWAATLNSTLWAAVSPLGCHGIHILNYPKQNPSTTWHGRATRLVRRDGEPVTHVTSTYWLIIVYLYITIVIIGKKNIWLSTGEHEIISVRSRKLTKSIRKVVQNYNEDMKNEDNKDSLREKNN